MKVIQLIQKPQLRGAEIFACQLSNHLVSNGHKVIVISIFSGDEKMPFEGEIIKLARPLKYRLFDVYGWLKLSQIIQAEQPDVIQVNAGDTLKFAVISKILFKWKVPIVFRNANKMSDFIDSSLKFKVNKFLLEYVDQIVSVSKLCEYDLKETFNIPDEKILTIPIGINSTENIDPDLNGFSLKGTPILINAGSLVPEKNHSGLISIFQKLLPYYPDALLYIAGQGKLQQSLTRRIKDNQLEEKVKFLGSRNDILQLIKNSNIFLLPSLIEGLPGVILEAMLCKVPVVAYNVGGISEVVKNGQTGWIVEKGDEEGFVQAIHQVMSNPKNTLRIVENAYQMVSQGYSNDHIAHRFEKVYEEVVAFGKQIQ